MEASLGIKYLIVKGKRMENGKKEPYKPGSRLLTNANASPYRLPIKK